MCCARRSSASSVSVGFDLMGTLYSAAGRAEVLLRAIVGKRLLCLGDVMLDCFVHGRVERISPEAPIPILSIDGDWETPGGAANVARNIAALGAHIELLGIVGDDQEGERLSRLVEQNG